MNSKLGIFSKFEGKVDDAFDGFAGAMFKSPIEPTQIAKKCEKKMHRSKLVGKGVQYAPTLYTVLVNVDDDRRLFGFYPTLAGEVETYLVGSAGDAGLVLECRPLVRFIADDGLKKGKFDVIAEVVTSNIVAELREEEAEHYGLDSFPKKKVVRQSRNLARQNPGPGGVVGRDAAAGQGGAVPHAQDVDDLGAASEHVSDDEEQDLSPQETMVAGRNRHEAPRSKRQSEYGFQSAMLVDARNGRQYPIRLESVMVGRECTNDIVLDDASISRSHIRISRDEMGAWALTDLNSTNGTKINGKRVDSAVLRFGDQITIGTTILLFQKG